MIPNSFRPGMKLEAIDKQSTLLHCVATVVDVLGEHILIHFDGWENIYDYWCDLSSPYIHPVGWCQENGKPISPPKGKWKQDPICTSALASNCIDSSSTLIGSTCLLPPFHLDHFCIQIKVSTCCCLTLVGIN